MEDISRRTVLLGTAGVATAAIAGCVSGDDDGTDDNGTDDGGSGENGSMKQRSVTRTGSDCAGQEPDTATVIVEEETYTIEGSLPSPTPCYEPELVETGYADGTLSVTVGVVEDGSENCTECEGQVNYDAVVELSGGTTVDSVSVAHESGKTHEVEQSAFVEGYPEITSSSIKTIQTDTGGGDGTGDAGLDRGDDAVTITGRMETPTPHYEAVLKEAVVERRQLAVTVEAESTLDEDEVGTLPVGFVEYEATIEMDDIDSLTGAKVSHPDSAYGFAWDENSASASGSHSVSGSSAESNSTAERPDQDS